MRDALKHVIDPELGVNIVDLGLVYDVEISQDGKIVHRVHAHHDGLPDRAADRGPDAGVPGHVPGMTSVDAEMVLRPPWSPGDDVRRGQGRARDLLTRLPLGTPTRR